MHFHASLVVLASALQLGTVFAQADSCPTQLKSYQPALAYCSTRYPQAPTTLTVTVGHTATSGNTAITSTTTAKTTSSASSNDGRSTKTLTSIKEHTVWSCPTAMPTNCKPIVPSGFPRTSSGRPGSGSGRPFGQRSEEEEYYAMAMAEYENDLEKRQYGGFSFSNNPAFTWLSVLAKGASSVQSVCSCIQTPSRTVTTTVTAKPTGK